MSGNQKETPMMKQYREVRAGLPSNTLLLFRLGDFYEIFGEDAQRGSKLLGITLTARNGLKMAGIPYHAAENYINKVLAQGVKVAICEQVETPKPGKLVKRELTRILTPGTTLENSQLESISNHYLLSFFLKNNHLQSSWLDLTTGAFQISNSANIADLFSFFHSLNPKEIIVSESQKAFFETESYCKAEYRSLWQQLISNRLVSEIPDFYFDRTNALQKIKETLKVYSLDGFGISITHPAIGCAGALLHYAEESLCRSPENIRQLMEYRCYDHLQVDLATQNSLEIFYSSKRTRTGSLLAAIDETVTPAGARLLEDFLSAPSKNLSEIRRRQNAVKGFINYSAKILPIRDCLREVRDIPRILGRLQNRLRNPRELGGIRDTLQNIPKIKLHLKNIASKQINEIDKRIHCLPNLEKLLLSSLNQELPSRINEGGIICEGYNSSLDTLLSLSKNNKKWLLDEEKNEQISTGIKNLKIKYNNNFGYFIEISKSNLSLVPNHYIRKQTMTNAERYYTESLKKKEREIINAEEKSQQLEEQLFQELVEKVLIETVFLEVTAKALAEIDLFSGWALLSRNWDYCCPEIDDSDILEIREGRHPVVEQHIRKEENGLAGSQAFVPNDTLLSSKEQQIVLLTGPNMAGKSTYIRQVALISLLSHIGCWVPAKSCRIGLLDRIFSRVGASDELSRGNSTFMVEMNETANILNNSTPKSLIILDEIGRGTSTYDGLSIAWAVIEYLHGQSSSGPKTLFATHYHELAKLPDVFSRIYNYSVAVREWNDQIIFIRQVVKGAADRSYGIQVARLAGIPDSVIERAKVLLNDLENEPQKNIFNKNSMHDARQNDSHLSTSKKRVKDNQQLKLF